MLQLSMHRKRDGSTPIHFDCLNMLMIDIVIYTRSVDESPGPTAEEILKILVVPSVFIVVASDQESQFAQHVASAAFIHFICFVEGPVMSMKWRCVSLPVFHVSHFLPRFTANQMLMFPDRRSSLFSQSNSYLCSHLDHQKHSNHLQRFWTACGHCSQLSS